MSEFCTTALTIAATQFLKMCQGIDALLVQIEPNWKCPPVAIVNVVVHGPQVQYRTGGRHFPKRGLIDTMAIADKPTLTTTSA